MNRGEEERDEHRRYGPEKPASEVTVERAAKHRFLCQGRIDTGEQKKLEDARRLI